MDKDPPRSRSTSRSTSRSSSPSSIGVLLGHFYPETGAAMKPLGDGFIKLIKMIIAPIIFCTVVVGIAGMEDMKKVGKTGGYALLYFEIVSTIALIVGLVIVNLVQPGAGMNIDPATLDTKGIAAYTDARPDAEHDRVPAERHPEHAWSTRSPRARSCRCCCSRCCSASRCTSFGGRGTLVFDFIEKTVARAVRDRRLHHEGGPDRRVRRDGVHDRQVRRRLAGVAGQADGHVLRDLPGVHLRRARRDRPRCTAFRIWKFIKYIKEELLIVLGTSSSRVGAAAHDGQAREPGRARSPTVGLVVPTGYSFNLDGTSIYLTMAAVFIAQATNTPMTLTQQLTLLRGAAADVQGRGRRHRQRLHRAGGDAVGGRQRAGGGPGADPRHRPLHVGSARADQPDRQRRRHGGGRQVGRRPRHRAHAPRS